MYKNMCRNVKFQIQDSGRNVEEEKQYTGVLIVCKILKFVGGQIFKLVDG